MRRVDRIDQFVHILKRIWENDPELRFGQLISLAFYLRSGQEYDGRLWHVEDDDFLERLMNNMSIEKSNDSQDKLQKIQAPIRGLIMDLNIFEGSDYRLEEEDGKIS